MNKLKIDFSRCHVSLYVKSYIEIPLKLYENSQFQHYLCSMHRQYWPRRIEQQRKASDCGNYVRGKTTEIFVVGLCAAIIFSLVGLKYSALLSVLVGLSVVIPYVGAFLVTVPIVIVGLLQFGLTSEFYILITLYLLLQILDGNLLVPIIFSDAVKLHPVAIILAVFIFGSMFGFWGVFFAIPMATFIKAVWNAWPST